MKKVYTVEDTTGDETTVSASVGRRIWMVCRNGSAETIMHFTADQALDLVEALRYVVTEVES